MTNLKSSPAVSKPQDDKGGKSFRWFQGMMMASVFSLVYIVTPPYLLTAVLAVIFQYPSTPLAFLYAAPMLISIIFKPFAMPGLVGKLTPILEYFDYEEIHETPNDLEILRKGKNFLFVTQPHGVISFCGICSAINAPQEIRCKIATAAASAVLYTPILKHVMGSFLLVNASKASLKKVLKKPGVDGCVVLYVGGIAELFLSCRDEERLFLSERKGFIKLALTEGVDIVPIYLFGNTSALTVLKAGALSTLSRKMQVSLTYFWGKYHLPIPRDDKLLYVRGKPLGMPQISNPSQGDIDKWHAKYCGEVTRIYNTYRERVPLYKHKKLVIV